MPLLNTFNFPTSSSGDNTVLPAILGVKHRIRQINIQNKHASTSTDITIKVDGVTVHGPITIVAGGFISLELASEEHDDIYTLPENMALVVNSSAAVSLLIFGYKRDT